MPLWQQKKVSAQYWKSQTNEESTLLAIGKIVKAIGVHGDVVLLGLTDDLTRFKKLKRVLVGKSEAGAVEAIVSHVAIEPRGVRMGFTLVTDRTAAEKLVGSLLFVEEKDAIRLPKGTYFVHDVVGLNVVEANGTFVGTVQDVLKYPANDVYVIENEGRTFLLPAVKEFIKKIDPETKTMTVELIEGLDHSTTGDDEDTDAD